MVATNKNELALWPYSPRNGVESSASVESLFAEPAVILSPQERLALTDFGTELFRGPEGGPNLGEVDQIKTTANRVTYYLDYFESSDGEADADSLGAKVQHDGHGVTAALYADAVNHHIADKAHKEIAARSRDWYHAVLSRKILSQHDEFEPESPKTVEIDYEPERTIGKLEELQQFRKYYRTVRQNLRETPDALWDAKTVLLDLHVARLNSLVAAMYPQAMQLVDQLSSQQNDTSLAQRERLLGLLPTLRRVSGESLAADKQLATGFLRRLDLVRNGAAANPGDYTPLSPEARSLADELESTPGSDKNLDPALPPEVIEKMSATQWDAGEFKTFLEDVLNEWGLLSQYGIDWDKAGSRTGSAEDDKWQVVITPRVTNLNTLHSKKIMEIPAKFMRGLLQTAPAGALPVAAHELAHVLQDEFSQQLADQLPLASIKGRRSTTTEEMGGIYEERRFFALAGKNRPTNTTYLRALEAKLDADSVVAAGRAYTEAKGLPVTQERANLAAKSVLRLYRYGGSNSQPLDYLEQELQRRALGGFSDDQVRRLALAGGSFSLSDMAALHKIGFLEIPDSITRRPAEDVLRIFMERYYNSK